MLTLLSINQVFFCLEYELVVYKSCLFTKIMLRYAKIIKDFLVSGQLTKWLRYAKLNLQCSHQQNFDPQPQSWYDKLSTKQKYESPTAKSGFQ